LRGYCRPARRQHDNTSGSVVELQAGVDSLNLPEGILSLLLEILRVRVVGAELLRESLPGNELLLSLAGDRERFVVAQA
jgi:hypothetical protein